MGVLLLLLACVGIAVGMGVDYRRECGGEGPALYCSSYREGGEVRCGEVQGVAVFQVMCCQGDQLQLAMGGLARVRH